MQRNFDKRKVYNAGKYKISEDLIHLHMSSHYRRILNAKKTVDNSPPFCYKLKRLSSCKPPRGTAKVNPPFENLPLTDRSLSTNSNKESFCGAESGAGSSRYHAHCIPEQPGHAKQSSNRMDLVDRITYDTKNGPAAYCDVGWMEVKAQRSDKRYTEMQQNNSNTTKASTSAKRHLQTGNANESVQKRKFGVQKKSSGAKGSKSFSSLDGKTFSKAFKSDAVSKLRSSRVYYPPRRKEKRNKTDAPVNAQITLEVSNCCKCPKICVCDSSETVLKKISLNPKEQSLTSSRDSAYNGGVSSLPESPTPDQRRKKECCCCCCEKKQQDEKPFETTKGPAESPKPPAVPFHPPPPPPKPEDLHQETFKKMQEDALYVKFIQDITTEILHKNLYTNKALKKVMKKHIKNNLQSLHKDRMLKEVENLRIQLGIPEDKTLLEFEADGEGGVRDASKFYPIISDSEFVMPKKAAVESNGSTSTRTPDKTSEERDREKSMSGSDTEGEIVLKCVREKRKEKTAVNRQNSSDDSDRPSDPKKRSLLKGRKPKYLRMCESTSSDSERSEGYLRKVREEAECGSPGSRETFFGSFLQKSSFLNKKNRSVSFWKNPDLNRMLEVKQKTVTRSKESALRGFAGEKHKND